MSNLAGIMLVGLLVVLTVVVLLAAYAAVRFRRGGPWDRERYRALDRGPSGLDSMDVPPPEPGDQVQRGPADYDG